MTKIIFKGKWAPLAFLVVALLMALAFVAAGAGLLWLIEYFPGWAIAPAVISYLIAVVAILCMIAGGDDGDGGE